MNPLDPYQALTAELLRHLDREEALLRSALANVTELNDALRSGNLPRGLAASKQQGPLEAALIDAGVAREAASNRLARALGLAPDGSTLSALAAALPPSLAEPVRATRERLVAVTTELSAIQTRNANLLGHLRSLFRGVLSGLLPNDAPIRYGPSGRRLEPGGGAVAQRRG